MFYLNLVVRALTIILGIMVVTNFMGLQPQHHESVLWLGYVLIGFGVLRLSWFLYQHKTNTTNHANTNESVDIEHEE